MSENKYSDIVFKEPVRDQRGSTIIELDPQIEISTPFMEICCPVTKCLHGPEGSVCIKTLIEKQFEEQLDELSDFLKRSVANNSKLWMRTKTQWTYERADAFMNSIIKQFRETRSYLAIKTCVQDIKVYNERKELLPSIASLFTLDRKFTIQGKLVFDQIWICQRRWGIKTRYKEIVIKNSRFT